MSSVVSFSEALRTWTRIALLSFGGPAGQIAVMHRILVEEKRWIGEERFLHALNYCMLLPGPEAQQLATYVGWLLHGTRGGLAAGTLFVLPGFVAIMLFSIVYVTFGAHPLVEGLFLGLKAAVIALVTEALLRIGRRALRNRTSLAVAISAFVLLAFFDTPFPIIIIAAAVAGFVLTRAGRSDFLAGGDHSHAEAAAGSPPPAAEVMLTRVTPSGWRTAKILLIWLPLWLAPVFVFALTLGKDHVLTDVGEFFSKMAVVTFGGAYAVLTYVAQQAVEHYGWVTPAEMLDGLGLAETTPGPLILVVQFVGFLAAYHEPGSAAPLLAGTIAACLTVWVTFVPCFLWIFLGAPYVESLRQNRALSGALAAITAAVVGVIAHLALWFTLHALFAEVRTHELAGLLRIDTPAGGSLRLPLLILTGLALIMTFALKWNIARTLAICAALGIGLTLEELT
jgi:chromate transporter